jgi:hypothetical protein
MADPIRAAQAAKRRLERAELAERQARAGLHAALVAALDAGVPQAQLARATGLSAEHLRVVKRRAEALRAR